MDYTGGATIFASVRRDCGDAISGLHTINITGPGITPCVSGAWNVIPTNSYQANWSNLSNASYRIVGNELELRGTIVNNTVVAGQYIFQNALDLSVFTTCLGGTPDIDNQWHGRVNRESFINGTLVFTEDNTYQVRNVGNSLQARLEVDPGNPSFNRYVVDLNNIKIEY